MIQFLAKLAFDGVTTYFKNRAEEKQAAHERRVAQIRGDQDWETTQAQNSDSSWKDEFALVVIMTPFIGMFIAVIVGDIEMVNRFKEAFNVLKNEVPDEYWYLLGVAFGATFALKKVPDVIGKIRGSRMPPDEGKGGKITQPTGEDTTHRNGD